MGGTPMISGDRGDTRRRRWPTPLTIRGTLYAGFGLVFVLWLASGYDLVRRTVEAEATSAAMSARLAAADQELSAVRVNLLVAAVYLRDMLLDTTPDAGLYYRERLENARGAIDRALSAYVPVVASPVERRSLFELRAEIAAFWQTVLPVLDWDTTRRSTEARILLRERVIPKRELILRISERIQELNRVALAREQTEMRRIYAALRWRVWVASGLALIAGLVVALVVTQYAGRLEAQNRRQLARDAENTQNLQRLSARLVSAQEDERRAIARELHDEVGQALTAIKVELAIAGRKAALTEREETAFQETRRLTDRALQQVRDISQLLHPAMLDDLGLPETIAWYLKAFSRRTGIRTDLVQDRMDDRVAGEIETCLYRIVQEALTNVARHAEATGCRVYIQRLPQTLLLTVEDDGRGFQADGTRPSDGSRGLGLLGISERVAGFGGSLRIETAPGKGTRLTVELPALPRASNADGGQASMPPEGPARREGSPADASTEDPACR